MNWTDVPSFRFFQPLPNARLSTLAGRSMPTLSLVRYLAAGVLLVAALPAPAHPQAATLILGTWHGTSICADPQTDRACHDEEVFYQIDSAAGPRGPVRFRADKVVAGVREDMGTLSLTSDSTGRIWSADLKTARSQARWTFEPQGEVMLGTLTELPSNRLIRRVQVRRIPSQ